MPSAADSLLSFSRGLRRVDDFQQLIELVLCAFRPLGLTNAWVYVYEREEDEFAVLAGVAGTQADSIRRELPVAPMKGDWLLEAIRKEQAPIIIPDATLNPNNPDVARRLGNRTVVNLPIGMVDKALGAVGGGTFGDEGVVDIGEAETAYLIQIANLTSIAIGRLVLRSRDAERALLRERLDQRQRLESLGLLAGGVAHDFNNLLTVIRTSVQFVRDEGPLTPAQQADLALISSAERSATELTRKLLVLGRKQPPALELVDLNEVVTDFLRLLARVIPATIETSFTPGQGLPMLRIDTHQVQQVLMNLALNSRDAMPSGGRFTLETEPATVDADYLRAHPWAKLGRHVLLRVTDTGVGMPASVVEHIFEPFFTTKAIGEGTGLGLAVTYGIIQQHEGMIHCRSEVGRGTTFEILLPAAEQTAALVSRSDAGAVAGGHERILVADDQALVLGVVRRVLSQAGYTVVAVANGEDAVAAATRERFDLHVLDSVMPGLSGRETCQRIRGLRPDARFLFSSGYGSEALPASFLSDLGIEILAKPFDADTLLRRVRATLDGPRPTTAR
jgi:signal transduction histidine kinase/ActR/RegA family two-component response regulator